MKKNLLLLFLSVFSFSISQTLAPKNVIATINQISGNADPSTTVKVDTDSDGKPNYSIVVNFKGYFEQNFTPVLSISNDGKLPVIIVWSVDETGKESAKSNINVETSEAILDKLKAGTLSFPSKTPSTSALIVNPQIYDEQPLSSTFSYKVSMLNTNFTIPIARFNLTKNDGVNSKQGDILLFNSIGAGFGISLGQLEKTTDEKGEIINTEFSNTFGIHLGFLFSAGSSSSENKNVFAPTLSVSVLDFQLGYGYEMGTLAPNQKKGFITLAYAIPLSKLVKGKYYIFTASKGFNSKNPLKDNENNKREYVNSFVQ